MKSVLPCLLLLLSPLAAQDPVEVEPKAEAVTWMTDWEAAKALAAKEGRDLLIDFTGSE